jgi:hypothetical protein
MAQDLVRVNPQSVEGYGRNAQACFDSIREKLVRLVDDTSRIEYVGPNAVAFKTKCGEMACDFSGKMLRSLEAIADAVRVQTSQISQALGGRPISILVNGAPISAPPLTGNQSDLVLLETSSIEVFRSTAQAFLGSIEQALELQLHELEGTDWVGRAKDAAVESVRHFTQQAKSQANHAQTAITKYIDEQIQAVHQADR